MLPRRRRCRWQVAQSVSVSVGACTPSSGGTPWQLPQRDLAGRRPHRLRRAVTPRGAGLRWRDPSRGSRSTRRGSGGVDVTGRVDRRRHDVTGRARDRRRDVRRRLQVRLVRADADRGRERVARRDRPAARATPRCRGSRCTPPRGRPARCRRCAARRFGWHVAQSVRAWLGGGSPWQRLQLPGGVGSVHSGALATPPACVERAAVAVDVRARRDARRSSAGPRDRPDRSSSSRVAPNVTFAGAVIATPSCRMWPSASHAVGTTWHSPHVDAAACERVRVAGRAVAVAGHARGRALRVAAVARHAGAAAAEVVAVAAGADREVPVQLAQLRAVEVGAGRIDDAGGVNRRRTVGAVARPRQRARIGARDEHDESDGKRLHRAGSTHVPCQRGAPIARPHRAGLAACGTRRANRARSRPREASRDRHACCFEVAPWARNS